MAIPHFLTFALLASMAVAQDGASWEADPRRRLDAPLALPASGEEGAAAHLEALGRAVAWAASGGRRFPLESR